MADQSNDQGADAQGDNDAADPRQNVPRTGIPGKGFDAGTGYGGGGNDSMYSAESSYGGQSGIGGSRMRGAYAGEGYGRTGPGEEQSGGATGGQGQADDATNVERDTDGRGSANDTTDAPADPNVEAVTGAFEGRGASDDVPEGGISRDGPDAVDLEDFSGGTRREPGR
ncbi:hypothetical protein tb265_04610 [Gemmatimonadetes bacterium T265]|nr:hypothetical protein tb265_04610 [Gemmatimonadetes bacterium T265]